MNPCETCFWTSDECLGCPFADEEILNLEE